MHVSSVVRQNIKNIRLSKGLSYMQMAEALSMDERNYRRIENGERKTLDIEQLADISKVLEVDLQRLFTSPETVIHNIENNIGGISNNEVNISGLQEDNFKKILDTIELNYSKILKEMKTIIEEKERIIKDYQIKSSNNGDL